MSTLREKVEKPLGSRVPGSKSPLREVEARALVLSTTPF